MKVSNNELRKIFLDTKRYYTENETLAKKIAFSKQNTKLYQADDYPTLPSIDIKRTQRVKVISRTTFSAAMDMYAAYPHKKIAVLNFASAICPGGRVMFGGGTQEEALCRCSTLYPTLDRKWLWKKYYIPNFKAHNFRHSDACIYSPDVIIFKTDRSLPEKMPMEKWVPVDVITCAAPNLMFQPEKYVSETGQPVRMDPEELLKIHTKRAKHILHVAALNGVDILVLGAFGCGAFKNDPSVVAKAYKIALDDYLDWFDEVIFAIYSKKHNAKNLDVFKRILNDCNSGK